MEETEEKKPSRRLLNLKKTNAAIRKKTAVNEQDSPFLNLPAEIRNKIYDLAMGGRTLHVTRDRIPKVQICNVSDIEHGTMVNWKPGDVVQLYYHQHARCRGANPPQAISLELLSVCRSIYNEAALVPFTSNTFLISDSTDLQKFTEKLLPIQQRAIQELHFVCQPYQTFHMAMHTHRFRHFSGLRRLGIRVEIPRGMREESKYREKIRRALRLFANGEMVFANVLVYRLDSGWGRRRANDKDTRPVDNKKTLDLAVQLKSELLMSKEQFQAVLEKEKAEQKKRKRDQEEEQEAKRAATAQSRSDEKDRRRQKSVNTRAGRGLRDLKE